MAKVASKHPKPPKKSVDESSEEKELYSSGEDLESLIQLRTQQLERAKKEWERTFDAIDEPVLILDAGYEIKRANLALARAVGKDIRELIGQHCFEELLGRTSPCEQCPLTTTFQGEPGHAVEIRHENDTPIYRLRSFPMSGNNALVVHTYHDITEEKEIQEKLIQSEKLNHIGMLAGQVAHELNNPLAGILAQSQLLLMDLQAPEHAELHNSIKDIETASLRCRKIILDLLNFSRRSPTNRHERHHLNQLIQQTLPLYHMTPPKRGPSLIITLDESLPAQPIDADKFQSVLLNLLLNAKAATPDTGEIHVTTRATQHHIQLIIHDTGEGIPKDKQQDVFKPFFTTKAKGLGTGLGLYIVEQIIQEHDGSIELTSEEGQGTTFCITLPKPPPST